MVKLVSLKKSIHFRSVLKDRKFHTDFFSIFVAKNFIKTNNRNNLIISFVMKKKIGNAVKRNKIRRKLKQIKTTTLAALQKKHTLKLFLKLRWKKMICTIVQKTCQI